jgi:hypothetical protein
MKKTHAKPAKLAKVGTKRSESWQDQGVVQERHAFRAFPPDLLLIPFFLGELCVLCKSHLACVDVPPAQQSV